MKVRKHVFDNYEIYTIKTNKFKTIKIQTLFLNSYEDEDRTKLKLLSNVLCRTNERCKTEIELSKEIMNLYNSGFSIYNSFNKFLTTTFRYTFLNEKYTEEGMNEKNIDFCFDIIFKPNINNNAFEKVSFDLSKKALESMYKREKEQPSVYAFYNATKLIRADVPIKIPSYGKMEDLKDINEKNLYEYYKKLIETSTVRIFVMGDIDEDKIVSQINEKIKDRKFKNDNYKYTKYELEPSKEEIVKIDEDNYNQSCLYMFYKIPELTDFEGYYVLQVLNKILGAPFTSKLFMQVREENSLAYSIYSAYYINQCMLYIEAGISKENYEKVLELSKDCIRQIQNGEFNENDINIAKEICISDLRSSYDSENSTISDIIGKELFDIENKESEIKKVTKEDIINLSKKFNLDVVYLLKGVKE